MFKWKHLYLKLIVVEGLENPRFYTAINAILYIPQLQLIIFNHFSLEQYFTYHFAVLNLKMSTHMQFSIQSQYYCQGVSQVTPTKQHTPSSDSKISLLMHRVQDRLALYLLDRWGKIHNTCSLQQQTLQHQLNTIHLKPFYYQLPYKEVSTLFWSTPYSILLYSGIEALKQGT